MLSIEEFLIGIEEVGKKAVSWDRFSCSILEQTLEIIQIDDPIYTKESGKI